MQTSEGIGEIATALVAAQKDMSHVKATHAGNVNNRYASLADVIDAVRPALNQHGIAVIQSPDMLAEHKLVTLTTRLVHTSGQWVQGTACAPAPEANAATNAVQMVGSAIRYLCRYGLEAMVCVAEESVDDADGQPAQPGAVRSLGTVPATADAAQRDDQQRRAFWSPIVPATDTDAAAEAGFQAGASDAEKAERHKLTDSILGELSRLNADPSELDKSLQDTYGVKNLAELTTEQMREALSAMTAQPAPGAAS